jgi:hypothetical protein
MSDHALHGTWQMTSLFSENSTGEKVYHYGDAPNGMLMDNPNGTMAAVLIRRGRRNLLAAMCMARHQQG